MNSDISVVIPTLGGAHLTQTINALLSSTKVPNEIIICIPRQSSHELEIDENPLINILLSEERGQVKQRIIGLKQAKYRYILQLDDDILVDAQCVENLIATTIRLGNKVAISPSFISTNSGKSLYKINTQSYFKKLYFLLLNGSKGYAPGTLTLAGTCFGIDHENIVGDEVEVDWLPGGCVLHQRSNVITENYYPFTGKAYGEDFFFSTLAREKGIKLFVSTKATCLVEPISPSANIKFADFRRYLSDEFKVRKAFVQRTDRSLIRMYIFYIIMILQFIFSRQR
jgi:glycosyltransferase involved in cell wall biosynthesis